MRFMRSLPSPLVIVLLLVATPVLAQDVTGTIDTREAIEKRIYELENMLGGDVSAERQAVTLRWLADLYVSVGRLNDAEAAYDRILVFYPYDTAASNAYAEFLLDTRGDADRALEATRSAIAWARSSDSPPLYLGQTFAIRARAFAHLGKCDDAIRVADEAILLSQEDAADDARRTRSRCLSMQGKDADAKAQLLEVIGDTGGSSPDDKSALIALLAKDNKKVSPSEVDRAIQSAIAASRKERTANLAREGATVVELTSRDRVRLEATLRPGDGASAVLFVPEASGRRATFTPFAQLLTLDGYTTLTLDPRGQGDSRCDSLPAFDAMSEHHRNAIADDIATAFQYLVDKRHIEPTRIVVIAAGDACSVVERTMHEHNIAPPVVYLSPVFPDADRDLASAVSFRPPAKALVLASKEDVYAVRSLYAFQTALATDRVTAKVYPSGGHGASLLREPAYFLDVDTWVKDVAAPGRPAQDD